MPAERKIPDRETLTKWWVDEDLSRKEIVERWYRETGIKVVGSAISNAVKAYGLPPKRNRWDDYLPWEVSGDHEGLKEAVLLRTAARERAGLSNPARRVTWLHNWLEELKDKGNPVVTYYADTVEGFHYVPRVPEDGDSLIRRPEVQEKLDQKSA